nr:hypothetical protein [Methanobrevibacter smithii]
MEVKNYSEIFSYSTVLDKHFPADWLVLMGNIIAISSAAVFHFPAGEREKPCGEI